MSRCFPFPPAGYNKEVPLAAEPEWESLKKIQQPDETRTKNNKARREKRVRAEGDDNGNIVNSDIEKRTKKKHKHKHKHHKRKIHIDSMIVFGSDEAPTRDKSESQISQRESASKMSDDNLQASVHSKRAAISVIDFSENMYSREKLLVSKLNNGGVYPNLSAHNFDQLGCINSDKNGLWEKLPVLTDKEKQCKKLQQATSVEDLHRKYPKISKTMPISVTTGLQTANWTTGNKLSSFASAESEKHNDGHMQTEPATAFQDVGNSFKISCKHPSATTVKSAEVSQNEELNNNVSQFSGLSSCLVKLPQSKTLLSQCKGSDVNKNDSNRIKPLNQPKNDKQSRNFQGKFSGKSLPFDPLEKVKESIPYSQTIILKESGIRENKQNIELYQEKYHRSVQRVNRNGTMLNAFDPFIGENVQPRNNEEVVPLEEENESLLSVHTSRKKRIGIDEDEKLKTLEHADIKTQGVRHTQDSEGSLTIKDEKNTKHNLCSENDKSFLSNSFDTSQPTVIELSGTTAFKASLPKEEHQNSFSDECCWSYASPTHSLAVPTMQEWSGSDDQSWLFHRGKIPQKSASKGNIDQSVGVWQKCVCLPKLNLYALPFVTPF